MAIVVIDEKRCISCFSFKVKRACVCAVRIEVARALFVWFYSRKPHGWEYHIYIYIACVPLDRAGA